VNFKVELIKPGIAVRKVVNLAWEQALGDLEKWMRKDLVKALTFGGLGIQGIAQTPFYQFISSPEGLSQLGIDASQPPKLLKAYERTAFSVKAKKRVISLKFGNVAKLKTGTPHPASGTGQLKVSSWLEWILDKKMVAGRGFVPRKDIRGKAEESIRLGAPLGGLMLPRGALGKSLGVWRFPAQFIDYEDDWLTKNVAKIEKAIVSQMVKLFQKRLNS
jgi:hypothetical protein